MEAPLARCVRPFRELGPIAGQGGWWLAAPSASMVQAGVFSAAELSLALVTHERAVARRPVLDAEQTSTLFRECWSMPSFGEALRFQLEQARLAQEEQDLDSVAMRAETDNAPSVEQLRESEDSGHIAFSPPAPKPTETASNRLAHSASTAGFHGALSCHGATLIGTEAIVSSCCSS
jgi:hypothetical protein